ncbi:hypothetical protein BG015_006442 [Linnemannia schmuckeri]|uniref:Uncharacterized protein n=1 Tax=Linnemannia schmuckeri TaxID=64567 RepID=A0A9P5VC24_9FUNG|nr:hypothetical protein BG015_006442 [Linnemannia schmuckeri]
MTFPAMRSLSTNGGTGSRDFFFILHYLPNLDDLDCDWIGSYERAFWEDANKTLEGRPSKLRRLTFHQRATTDEQIANFILPWIPHLREITIKKRLSKELAEEAENKDTAGFTLASQKLEILQDQQCRVFDQFARLKRLSVLELGMFVNYGGPISQTLELTLGTGLDRLSALTNLDVFGFEGVDYRLGRAEL